MTEFNGFPAGFFRFFEDLAENNDRNWFEANKARYEADVAEPCLSFIAVMSERLPKFAPTFTAIAKKQGGSMFRIYRDTRFSKDKSPYKTNAGLHFRHRLGKNAHAPGYYLHLEPGSVFAGGGMWRPESAALLAIRKRIAEKRGEWKKVVTDSGLTGMFGALDEGDPLQRPPRGFEADHAFVDDLKKRSFFVMKKGTIKAARGPGFVDEVAECYDKAGPLMKFLCAANDVPF